MDDKNYESTAARLERIAATDPENPAIFYNLGVAYTFLKREEEALAEFEKCVALNSGYVEAWLQYGANLYAKTERLFPGSPLL